MLFCLNLPLRPYPFLCYSVSKHPSIPICHYVILSQNVPLSLSVPMLFCLKTSLCPYLSLYYSVSKHPSVTMLFCLKTSLCPYLSLCYSVSKRSSVPICHYVILSKPTPSVPIRHYVILSQNVLLILIIRCLNRSVYTKKTTVNVDRLENNLYLCTRKIVIITGYKYPIYKAENQQILVYTLVISETRNNIYNTKTL